MNIKEPVNYSLLYHCYKHSSYLPDCNQCRKTKNYYWMNQRNQMITCEECHQKYLIFNKEYHLTSPIHKLNIQVNDQQLQINDLKKALEFKT